MQASHEFPDLFMEIDLKFPYFIGTDPEFPDFSPYYTFPQISRSMNFLIFSEKYLKIQNFMETDPEFPNFS